MIRVDIKPELLSWARKRADLETGTLAHRFPKFAAWERGTLKPTLKQIEDFAKATHTPIGFLFLPEPPVERIPIPDFRTIRNKAVSRPSPDLLDMIYVCQQRQEWYRDFARSERASPLSFVGSASLNSGVASTARIIRYALRFDLEQRRRIPTWSDALRLFISQADEAGIMVMCSGVVLNNNTRRLDPEEFRGFALSDDLAPLVFINGADTKAAQMFTLAHELAHIWLGQSALNTFLLVADYYLVAHALANEHTVVTHEVASTSTKKIKIPDACIGLGIKCMTPYEMLRVEGAPT